MPGNQAESRGALLYNAEYYRQHCGPIPYGRTRPWLEFFAHTADALIRSVKPRRVFDAGCAWGFLVEAFRDRGVEAWGVDLSPYAIGQVRQDLRPYCRMGSLTEPIEGSFDLITCIEVLEHMPENDAEQAVRNLCGATDTILFSSTPSDFAEPTHVNVRPVVSWLHLFSEQGFSPDVIFDASFVSPHAFLLRRRSGAPLPMDTLVLFAEKLRIRGELAQAERRLKDIYDSPGWRLIRKYRDWLSRKRERRPAVLRLVDSIARWFLQGAVSTAQPPASQPPLPQTTVPEPTSGKPAPASAIPASAGPLQQTPSCQTPGTFSYKDWILEQEPDDAGLAAQRDLAAAFSYQPKISIIVPVYRVPFEIVNEMIASVMGQTYGNWELCVAHADPGATNTRQNIVSLAEADPRIKVSLLDENRGISGNSNEALALATGEFIALLDHDDTLAPFALFEVVQALNEQPSIDFLYSDRDEITHTAFAVQRVNPLLKPSWSPEILLCVNYLTHFNVIAAEHVRAIGGWREEMDGAQDWDLFLRAISRAKKVHHIPKVLYHWRQIETSVAGGGLATKPYAEDAQLRTVRDHCQRQGWSAEVAFDVHRRLRILWKQRPEQKISVILVSAGDDAEAMLHAQGLKTGSAHSLVEIIVPLVSDISPGDPQRDPRIHTVRVPAGASLAEKMRRSVEHSTGDILVFLDQTVNPADEDWLSEMAGPLQVREIGIVGAKLLQPGTGEIRHAGIVFTEGNRPEYIFAGEFVPIETEFGTSAWYRNWSAVSGACFSLRREVWDAISGVSAALRYPRPDVDLCLRVQFQAGLRVLYNPFACFFQDKPAAMEGWQWSVSQEAADRCIQECFPGGDPYFHSKLTCREGRVQLRSRANRLCCS
jgi:cellulose synthase/poly-beta-1,6-N-acetylglucosamine synthase-like glycosyltransferase